MRPTRYTKGIGERTLDAIWAIICVKPAIVNTLDYIADWKYHNAERVKSNLAVAAGVLFFIACGAIIINSLVNAGGISEYDRAKRNADHHSAEFWKMHNGMTGRRVKLFRN
jgi:hypothetical protein